MQLIYYRKLVIKLSLNNSIKNSTEIEDIAIETNMIENIILFSSSENIFSKSIFDGMVQI